MSLAIIVLLYVALMIPIGIYVGRKVKNSTDYVLAGRSLPFYMALATVFATWFGSESILGAGSAFAEGGLSAVIEDPFGAGLCLIIAGIFFNKKLYRLSHLTIGDYYKNRYNTVIATFLSIVIVASYFGWVGAQFLALGLVLSSVVPGLSLPIAIMLSVSLVLVYTYFGGMFSIAWLDTIQSIVIILGLMAVAWFALDKVGGFDVFVSNTPADFWRVLPEDGANFTTWAIFATALMTMGFGSIPQQDIYQRAMSAKSATISMWASIIGGLLYITIVMLPLLIAGVARILYPEVLASDSQLLILTLIQDQTPLIIQALFFGALVSAIISTASGALLAPGTLLAENIVKPFYADMSDQLRLRIIRSGIIAVAVVSLVMALSDNARIYDLVSEAYSITLVAGFVPLAAGLYWSRANSLGALISVLFGMGVWQYVDRFISTEIPAVFFGFFASIIGMILGTYLGQFIKREEAVIH